MKTFLSAPPLAEATQLVNTALQYKENPLADSQLGTGKTLGLIFYESQPAHPPQHTKSRG